MRLITGTSGFAYKEWKGNFYPPDIRPASMLSYYSERLNAVEINNTFYRMPNVGLLEGWSHQVPDDFQFAIKAPRIITHIKRLKNVEQETGYFIETTAALKQKRGPLLFQFAESFGCDRNRLVEFLRLLPEIPAAFEFRHQSWANPDVFTLLRERDFAFCISDGETDGSPSFVTTAAWGYLRLRQPEYSESDLLTWRTKIRESHWKTVYVFFKHEDGGAGPRLARQFSDAFALGS